MLASVDALKYPIGMAAEHDLPDLDAITDLSADFLCDAFLIGNRAAAVMQMGECLKMLLRKATRSHSTESTLSLMPYLDALIRRLSTKQARELRESIEYKRGPDSPALSLIAAA